MARRLVNGGSILRDTTCRAVSYFHVELDAHDILLAENAPAESYLDTGNRGMFQNADAPLLLHPDFGDDQARRETLSCVPFADAPETMEPIWRTLAERARAIGMPPPEEPETTDDPSLRVMVDGKYLMPIGVVTGHYQFLLPRAGTETRLLSRSAVPGDPHPWIEDRRRLGVMLCGLAWRSAETILPIPLDDPRLTDGWWADEWHDLDTLRRWTNGDALLPSPGPGSGPWLLEVWVAATRRYPLIAADPTRAAEAA